MSDPGTIFYMDEHRSCAKYSDKRSRGFRYLEIGTGGAIPSLEDQPLNYLFCILEGGVKVNCLGVPERLFKAGEMVLIAQGDSCSCQVVEDLRLLIFGFDIPSSDCDKMIFEDYAPLAESVEYDFSPTPIKRPLRSMLDLLVVYLQSGLNCMHLHELKHREFFLLIRGFYSRQEIARLLYPLLGRSLSFRNTILQNYRKASNINDLVQFTRLSRSNFFVRFKQEFGMTAKEWLAVRIKQDIMRLASNRRLSTKEIMHRLNFDSPQQFNRFCKANFGLPPTQLIGQIRDHLQRSDETV